MLSGLNISKVYIVHVKKGFEERKKSIDSQMAKFGISVEYMLDGDMNELTPQRLALYFRDAMQTVSPEASCSIKHLLIYEDMVKNEVKDALIFEDDIFLMNNFISVFNETITELHNRTDIEPNKSLISYENSTLRLIQKDELNKDQHLYLREAGRCAGAYYFSLPLAKMLLDKCKIDKMAVPIDWYHNELSTEKLIDIYWCHPAIAEQGSQNGKFDSSLDLRKRNTWWRRLKWNFRKLFK